MKHAGSHELPNGREWPEKKTTPRERLSFENRFTGSVHLRIIIPKIHSAAIPFGHRVFGLRPGDGEVDAPFELVQLAADGAGHQVVIVDQLIHAAHIRFCPFVRLKVR